MTKNQQRVKQVYEESLFDKIFQKDSTQEKLEEINSTLKRLNSRILILERELNHYKSKELNRNTKFEGDVFEPEIKKQVQEVKKVEEYVSAKKYLVRISSIEFLKTFQYDENYLNSYLVELEEFYGKFIVNQFVNSNQITTGTIINCFFDNNKIKNYQIVYQPDEE